MRDLQPRASGPTVPRHRFRVSGPRAGVLVLALAIPAVVVIILGANAASASPSTRAGGYAPKVIALNSAVPAATSVPALTLSTASAPLQICALNTTACPAATPVTRVQLTAQAAAPTTTWPAVQVAFVVETTAYDGVYDPNDPNTIEKQIGAGEDICEADSPGGPLCEESNAVPFFVANIPAITSVIQAANPHSQVSYAMVDFGETCDVYDDYCDQVQYHVDVSQFLGATNFGNTVAVELPRRRPGWGLGPSRRGPRG